MPVRERDRYPADWAAIAREVKDRAGWCCQRCPARHGAWGYRCRRGFVEVQPTRMAALGHGKPPFRLRLSRGGYVRVLQVVLAAAHLDHTPENVEWDNLVALCQRCHLAHDVRQHARNAAATRRAGMLTPELL